MTMRFALILAAVGLAAAQEQPAPTGKGVIEGVVLNEVTRDPIRKAFVSIGGPAQPMNVTTDQSGRFVVRGLPPGQYWMAAQRPGFGNSPASESGRQVTLAANEEKTGGEITLMPLASISGRIVDEFNAPIVGCNVSAMKSAGAAGNRRFGGGASAQPTNDKGDYRVQDVAPGRYYIFARCSAELIAPHPLMALDDPRVPHQVYRAQFFPGGSDPSGATRISLTPGAEVKGIDMRMHRVDAFTVRGRVGTAEGNVVAGPATINLSEDIAVVTGWTSYGGATDERKGTFEIRNVPAGSYLLSAATLGEGPRYQARLNIEVGERAPDPIEVVLSPGADITGTIETENRNGAAAPQINLSSFEQFGMATSAQATADSEGAFVLHGVFPGRQMLSVGNVAGYIKELRIGDKQVNPQGFDLTAGTAGPWRIVMGTKGGKLSGTVAGSMPESGTVFAVLLPSGSDVNISGGPAIPVNRDGRFELSGLQPGRYRVFAMETANPYAITAEPELLKAIESRGQSIDVAEGDSAKVAPEIISAEELKRLLREVE